MDTELRPLFLLSLPRSGSTLVQRVLVAHDGVASTPEPWLGLPQIYAMRESGVDAEYDHRIMSGAVSSFADDLPGGRDTYLKHVRRLLLALYREAAPDETRWFVDKTPRYHLIVDDLARLFPDAALVFLWRNPLSVVASMTDTWDRGRWYPCRHGIDLFTGMENLLRAADDLGDRAVHLRYEDLVSDPGAWNPLFARLGVEFRPSVLDSIGEVGWRSRFGDPTEEHYAQVSTAPLEKWPRTLTSAPRVAWCRRYLDWIGPDRLSRMGYDHGSLVGELAEVRIDRGAGAMDIARGIRERLRVAKRRWQGVGPVHRDWPLPCWPWTGRPPVWQRDPRILARTQHTRR